jgi:hypothetical protein
VVAGFVGSGEFFQMNGGSAGTWWKQAVLALFGSGGF